MKVLIENYRNTTAEHCGSGAMRNLINHYCNLDLPEGVVFGLSGGLDCLYFDSPMIPPGKMIFGRSFTMEQDLARHMGLDYEEITEPDNQQAWLQVKAQIDAGRPTMLSGDIFYLDYRAFKVHFPGHRFVLLGYDEETQQVFVADRTDCETQVCSMEALRQSRNPSKGITTLNLWGRFKSGEINHSLPQACEAALRTATQRMLGLDPSQKALIATFSQEKPDEIAGGIAGIGVLAEDMCSWHQQENAGLYARMLYNFIIKFGTGGGLFRNLYAEFLRWSAVIRPDLVSVELVQLGETSAALWNQLGEKMNVEGGQCSDEIFWLRASDEMHAIYLIEQRLFNMLADRL